MIVNLWFLIWFCYKEQSRSYYTYYVILTFWRWQNTTGAWQYSDSISSKEEEWKGYIHQIWIIEDEKFKLYDYSRLKSKLNKIFFGDEDFVNKIQKSMMSFSRFCKNIKPWNAEKWRLRKWGEKEKMGSKAIWIFKCFHNLSSRAQP